MVLFFYPKDDTPLCAIQACSLRDIHDQLFGTWRVVVLGVSAGSQESHAKFASKYRLPFSLLVDEEMDISRAYGVLHQQKRFGRLVACIKRTTFLINAEGTIFHVFSRPRTALHGDQVLKHFGVEVYH